MKNIEVRLMGFLNCKTNGLHEHKVDSPALQRIASGMIFVQFFLNE